MHSPLFNDAQGCVWEKNLLQFLNRHRVLLVLDAQYKYFEECGTVTWGKAVAGQQSQTLLIKVTYKLQLKNTYPR